MQLDQFGYPIYEQEPREPEFSVGVSEPPLVALGPASTDRTAEYRAEKAREQARVDASLPPERARELREYIERTIERNGHADRCAELARELVARLDAIHEAEIGGGA